MNMSASIAISVNDSDIIKMVQEFYVSRHLDISLLSLERESAIINGHYSEDGLFVRQLVLDGQWEDTLEFLEPLEGRTGYDSKQCRYLIYKHKYLELLCLKHEPGPLQNHEFTQEEVVLCLTELEELCPARKEYDSLCFLLTLPSLTDDPDYAHWNPSSARLNCFNQLYPLIKKFVGLDKKPTAHSASKNDRLVNLIVKGMLYELCVDTCTARACGAQDNAVINHPLGGSTCTDADLGLVSWLQKVPSGTFACPFEKKTLKLKINRLEKPQLEATWAEQLLVPPIRPKQFPHSAIPAKTRSAQILSQSMTAMYDGLSFGLTPALVGSMNDPRSQRQHPSCSRSFAAPTQRFLLSNSLRSERKNNPMNESVERLFTSESPRTKREASPLIYGGEKQAPHPISPEELSPNSSVNQMQDLTPSKHNGHYDNCAVTMTSTPQRPINPQIPQPIKAETQTPQPISVGSANQSAVKLEDRIPPSSSYHSARKSTSHHNTAEQPITNKNTSYQPVASQNTSNNNAVESPASPRVEDQPSVNESTGDLYAQYREQKQRYEELQRKLGTREEEWRKLREESAIRNEATDDTQESKSSAAAEPGAVVDVPKLNLGEETGNAPMKEAWVDHEQELCDIIDDAPPKQFVAVETLEEQGPVRAIAFHPNGFCYAVGSNTKILRVCQFPDVSKVTPNMRQAPRKPTVLAKKVKHHVGSIYCAAWNTLGTVIATGSNDHNIKCVQWISEQNIYGSEKELSVHDGTVRDVAFLTNEHLLSGGAGDCSVCLTDVATGSVVRRYKGHQGHVLSIFPHCESQKFMSGGQDKKAVLWDVRMSVPIHTYSAPGTSADSAFASVCLDPAPRVLAAGHDNSCCSLFDLRQGRVLQSWRSHTDEVRSVRFNNDATYFLSGSYDTTVKLADMQGDITQPLKTVQVAEHSDKVIQTIWHPLLPSFITSSADKTVTCWAIQIDPNL